MEYLIKQTRARFVNSSARDGRTQPEKTQSFKGERKRSQSWLRRQLSRQMSRDYDTNDGEEYQTALAAAAFAVKALEESRNREQKMASRTTESLHDPKPRTKSIKFSDEGQTTEKEKVPVEPVQHAPSIKKVPTLADIQLKSSATTKTETTASEKAIGPAPSIKKAPTFPDKNLDSTIGRKATMPKPDLQQPTARQTPSSTKPGSGDPTADAWEKSEMAKIKEKYENLNDTIGTWENKKKTKAKRRLESIEAQLDKQRAKAMQHYRSKITRIEGIAGGARAQAEENRKKEELKVKEKANKIRSTGKVPATCLCF